MRPSLPYGLWDEDRLRRAFEQNEVAVEVFERELERIMRYEATVEAWLKSG